jgi:hypothetical protein
MCSLVEVTGGNVDHALAVTTGGTFEALALAPA